MDVLFLRVPGQYEPRSATVSNVPGDPSLWQMIMCKPQHSRHGFAIVELLVVIAIIGLLVAVLLPAIPVEPTPRTGENQNG